MTGPPAFAPPSARWARAITPRVPVGLDGQPTAGGWAAKHNRCDEVGKLCSNCAPAPIVGSITDRACGMHNRPVQRAAVRYLHAMLSEPSAHFAGAGVAEVIYAAYLNLPPGRGQGTDDALALR
jgi:hypothetical protein